MSSHDLKMNSSSSATTSTTSTPLSAIAARRERQRLAAQTASTPNSGSSAKHSTPLPRKSNTASPVNQSQSRGSKKKKANKNKKLLLLDSSDDSPSQFIPLDNDYSSSNPFSLSSSKSKPKASQKSREKPTTESREEEIDSSQDEDQDPKSTRFSTASQSLNSILKANPTPKSKPKEKESDSFSSDRRNQSSRGGIGSTFIPRFNRDEKTSRSRNVVRLSLNRGANDIETDKKGKGKQKEGEEQEGLVLGMMKDETLISTGMYSIQVLSGSISIDGSSMGVSNALRIVLAPTTNPLPVIKCMHNPRSNNSSSSRIPLPSPRYFNNEAGTSSSSSYNPLDLLVSSSFDAIVLIKSLPASTRELNNLSKVCSLVGLDPFSFTSVSTSTSTPNQTDSESDQDPNSSFDFSPSRLNSFSGLGIDQSLSLPGFKPILSPIQSSSLSTLSIPKGWKSALKSIEDHFSNGGDGVDLEDQYQNACQDENMQIDDEGQENGSATSRPGVFVPSFNRNYNDFDSERNETNWRRKSRPPLVVLIKGPKKVGKSTLARLSLERTISSMNSQRDSNDERSRDHISENQKLEESANQNKRKVKKSNKVCFLELDLGQGEFGPPGIIGIQLFSSTSSSDQSENSLPIISPNWASSRIPIKAHFFGDTTPRDDPETYLRFIQDLLNVYRELCEREKMSVNTESEDEVDFGIPLVINTCGWSKGLGSDLLNQIENMSRPSHVFNLEAGQIGVGSEQDDESHEKIPQRRKPYLDHLGHETGIGSLVFNLNSFESVLKSTESKSKQGSGVKRLNQSDSRTISLMTYFHSTSIPSHQDNAKASDAFGSSISNHNLPSSSNSDHSSLPRYDFSKPLMFSKPYIIDIETGLRGGLHVLDFGSRIENRHKLEALNGSIVGIVLCDAVEGDGERSQDQQNRDHDVNMDLEINSSLENQPTGSDQRQDHSKWWNALTQPLPPIETSTCLGLGIVRSVDVVNNQIHLLTPISLSAITSTFESSSSSSSITSARAKQPKLALVKGIVDLPIWASLDFKGVKAVTNGTLSNRTYQHSGLAGVKVEDVPYLDWPEVQSSSFGLGEEASIGNGEDTEGEGLNDGIHVVGNKKRKIRRNLMRRSQM